MSVCEENLFTEAAVTFFVIQPRLMDLQKLLYMDMNFEITAKITNSQNREICGNFSPQKFIAFNYYQNTLILKGIKYKCPPLGPIE